MLYTQMWHFIQCGDVDCKKQVCDCRAYQVRRKRARCVLKAQKCRKIFRKTSFEEPHWFFLSNSMQNSGWIFDCLQMQPNSSLTQWISFWPFLQHYHMLLWFITTIQTYCTMWSITFLTSIRQILMNLLLSLM